MHRGGSQTFNGWLGVTLYVDMRTGSPDIRDRVRDYSNAKTDEQSQPNWIGIGEGAAGWLFVIVVQRDPAVPLAVLLSIYRSSRTRQQRRA